jgi:hypothetical protein
MNGDRRGPGRAIAWAVVIGAGSAFLLQGSTQGAATSSTRGDNGPRETAGGAPARLFLADLDGDGFLDKLRVAGDGALSVALNRGGGAFEPVGQTIPGAAPHAVLADDLDGDGRTDLYLLTARGAMALLGDGTGLLREATAELGLADAGRGVRAERVDLDGIPPLELVLHQVDGDVVFWPEGSAFRRDVDSPPQLGGPASRGRVAGGPATVADADSPEVALGSEGPAGSASWSISGPRASVGSAVPLAPSEEASGCADSIADQARPTTCIKASTTPTLGSLYPLGQRFFVATTGRVGIGTTNPAYDLDVVSSFHAGSVTADSTIKAGTTITLDALTGRTKTKVLEITGGSDLVEGFETGVRVEPGTVMCIDATGTGELVPSSAPYDRRVAGIVSGAGGVSPGIRMGQTGVLDGEVPVAMAGRVYVRATAEGGSIEPGDLLTTSASIGRAMKAADPARSPGAVLGKALTGLSEDAGLVLVLVDLQ